MITIDRIFCPVDFSPYSIRAFDHAVAMARWYEARVLLAHVYYHVPVLETVPSLGAGDVRGPLGLVELDREGLVIQLEDLAGRAAGRVPVEIRLLEATANLPKEIVAQADAFQADLIVVGSHGRSGFERLLLGSTADRILRHARCPVMVVPPHVPEADDPPRVPFTHILCPIDFSDSSLRALEYALHLAQESDGHLTLQHVIELPPELREVPASPDFNVDAVRAAAEAEVLRRLRALVPASARTYCKVHTTVSEGKAHREVLRAAAELGADLIVMGVLGRGAVDLMMFGSNTSSVVRGATCPVLTVRQP